MAVSPLIIFIASSSFFYLSAECRMVRGQPVLPDDDPTFRPLCTRMCRPAPDFRENALLSFKCSCSKSCAVYKDCCYDSPYKHTTKLPQFDLTDCISVVHKGYYRAVMSCPKHIHDQSCSQRMGFEPPVTSRITNITYGNAYCAKCNEDGDDLIKWNVELRCGASENQAQFRKFIYNNGEFWGRVSEFKFWEPCQFHVLDKNDVNFSILELRPCSGLPRTSKCSSTWTNASVKEKCRSYEDPVFIENTPYRNSHCVECNYVDTSYADCIPAVVKNMLAKGKIGEDKVRDCMAKSPDFCIPRRFVGGSYRISDIFRIVKQDKDELEPACFPFERYDENTQECRPATRGMWH